MWVMKAKLELEVVVEIQRRRGGRSWDGSLFSQLRSWLRSGVSMGPHGFFWGWIEEEEEGLGLIKLILIMALIPW